MIRYVSAVNVRYTKTSMAVNSNFSFRQLKLHNSHNVCYANHCTKAVVLPAVVIEENCQQ